MNFVGKNVAMGPDEFVVFIEINIYGSFYGKCFENKFPSLQTLMVVFSSLDPNTLA